MRGLVVSMTIVALAVIAVWFVGGLVGFDIALFPTLLLSLALTAVISLLSRRSARAY